MPRREGDGFRIERRPRTAVAKDLSSSRRQRSRTSPPSTASSRDDFGTRVPHVFADAVEHPAPTIRWRPLLTENVHPQILVGYGDPGGAQDRRRLVAGRDVERRARRLPDPAFGRPRALGAARALSSLQGSEPDWAAKGRNIADFWAPEMAQVGDEYWLVFTARQANNALAIGLARAPSPLGPWTDNGAPLVTGKPVNTTGPRLRRRPAADERRSDRFAPVRRCRTATNICSGRTTPTASGRGRWRCCCASIPS